ncbi:hypothetical protein [Oscillatoria acuminata]|nr:hypothetical protein [Oscillatoria acuminata]
MHTPWGASIAPLQIACFQLSRRGDDPHWQTPDRQSLLSFAIAWL